MTDKQLKLLIRILRLIVNAIALDNQSDALTADDLIDELEKDVNH